MQQEIEFERQGDYEVYDAYRVAPYGANRWCVERLADGNVWVSLRDALHGATRTYSSVAEARKVIRQIYRQ